MDDELIVIAGPTATGKTAAAIEVARRMGGELVGADSVQVYRGFNVGSAKPQQAELRGVLHHLIDIINPNEAIDAAQYAKLADEAITAIRERGHVPIVVGGTGLWIRALLRGLVDVPPVDPKIRSKLEARAAEGGSPAMHRKLQQVDPITAEAVHPNDQFRIIRALEVYEQTGEPLGELRATHALGEPRYNAKFFVVDLPRDHHRKVIEARVDAMIESGWIDEVQELREQWGDDVRALGSVGYREVLQHLRDDIPLEDTKREIIKSTRTYARRQRTWFQGEPGIGWRGTAQDLLNVEGLAPGAQL